MAKLSGGGKMRVTLAEIGAKLANAATLNVGFLEGSTESKDGQPSANVAAMNEFGTSKAPPRPFFRPMIARGSPEWGTKMGKVLVATNYDVSRTLALMGEDLKGELVASIDAVTEPRLAPSTIKRKGFDKPLVDTGDMRRAVDYEVKP
jgi:hypothetical protein